jgi:hypothetical protein
MTYQRTTVFVASSLYFSFANQYSLGGGFPFPIVLVPKYKLSLCHTPSNLIYLAFRELMSLCVGCVITWSRGSHHSVSKFGSINQVVSFYFLYFYFYLMCCLRFESDLVSNQFRSYCLLPMLFLIGCIELSLLVLKKRCHVFSKGEGA